MPFYEANAIEIYAANNIQNISKVGFFRFSKLQKNTDQTNDSLFELYFM